MLRRRDAEAKELLTKVVKGTLAIIKKNTEAASVGAIAEAMKKPSATSNSDKTLETPSLNFRLQTARFLTELELWKKSVSILETVVGDDGDCLEAWYLLAFALFRLGKHATAEECCLSVRNLIVK